MSKLFISHSSQDSVWCQLFVAALRTAGHTCFFDQDSIPGSAEWIDTIQHGVVECDLCMLVLSPAAWSSPWVKREWQLALRLNKPILPVEYLPTPDTEKSFITGYQMVKAIGVDAATAAQLTLAYLARVGYDATFQPPHLQVVEPAMTAAPATPRINLSEIQLPVRLARLGFKGYIKNGVEFIVPPVCAVPADPFIMGSDKQQDPQAKDNELPQYQSTTGAYQIGSYPLTVCEYRCIVEAGVAKPPNTYGNVTWKVQQKNVDHPVVCITWLEAYKYAQWLSLLTEQPWRLPTEPEWEKAARGTDGRIYPWGNQWDKERANTNDGGPGTTTPVGVYSKKGDASPYGVHDMAGNVWEWTSSIYLPYPYRVDRAEKSADITSARVLRGGTWYLNSRDARAAFRHTYDWGYLRRLWGVRLVFGPVG